MLYQKLSTARDGIKNFKGSQVIKAPIQAVAKVLFAPDTQRHWIGGLESVTVFEKSGETPWKGVPKKFELYQLYQMPPPISNRDYVIAGQWDIRFEEDEIQQAILYLHSIERNEHPERDHRVRAALNLQVYTLKALPDDQGTQIDVEINVDPLGNFPVFVVNLYGSTWCSKTLSALEKVVLGNH